MKKHILLCLLLIIEVIVPIVAQELKDLPKFAVISDTHFGTEHAEMKVRRALRNILQKESELDAVFVVGDLTNNGFQEEYDHFKVVFDEEVINKGIPAYYCMGNHDRFNDFGNSDTRYENTLKQPLNQYVVIKGYPFILLSMENLRGRDCFLDFTKAYFKEKLEDAATNYPDKPIFVFFHMPIEGTVYGSYVINGRDSWGTPDLKELCESYPQIIAFSGHSHYPLGDERSIHQDKFTSINDGSVAYCEIENGFLGGSLPPRHQEINEGCLVYVEQNEDVTIKRLSLTQNIEIAAPWSIKAPHNSTAFTYKHRDGGKSPFFKENDKIEIIHISNISCEIEFPQATDDENVHQYIVEVVNTTGEVDKFFRVFSLFYLNHLTPEKMTVTIPELQPKTEYKIRVIAVDSFGNKSQTSLLSDSFNTMSDM